MAKRLIHSFLGFFFGSVVAIILWWLYGIANSRNMVRSATHFVDIVPWIQYIGGLFAILGFFLKEKSADILGNTISHIYDAETRSFSFLELLSIMLISMILFYIFIAVV